MQQATKQHGFSQVIDLANQAAENNDPAIQHFLFWYLKGAACFRLKQFSPAAEALTQAKQRQPKHPQIRLKLIEACLHDAQFQKAYEELNQLTQHITELLAKDWFRLGVLQHQLNLEHQALKSFSEAVKVEPNNIEFVYNLALSQKNCGLLKDAQQNLKNIVNINPNHVDARYALTLLNKATPEINPLSELTSLLSTTDKQGEIKLRFSLAKCFEDLRDFDSAFAQMHKANSLRRQRMNYQVSDDVQLMQTLNRMYSAQKASRDGKAFPYPENNLATQNSHRPIFIVGLPRSGSTLVERLLTQPDNVASAGELLHFSAILSKLTHDEFGASANRTEFIQKTAQIRIEQLSNHYLAATAFLARDKQILVDKMPLNFLNVGAILRAMPTARVIHMQRHPIDNVLAIYKTLFEQAYPYSYNLEDIAHYLAAERELMTYFKNQFQQQIFTVNYEELVTSTETVTSRLFDFCGLEFKPEYLDISKNQSSAATASATQVRRGIYQSSVANWRNYEKYLQPAIDVLQEKGLF